MRNEVRQLLLERGYRDPYVFGSVALSTDSPSSDLDLLVDAPEGLGLTQLARAVIDLESLVGLAVDLVPATGYDLESPTRSPPTWCASEPALHLRRDDISGPVSRGSADRLSSTSGIPTGDF